MFDLSTLKHVSQIENSGVSLWSLIIVDSAICEGLEQTTIFHCIERRAPKAIIVLYTIFNKYFHCVEVIIVVLALTESSLFV